MRHGSVGHRNDVVASDLDTSDSRRNDAGKAAIAKAMEMPAGTDRERGSLLRSMSITIRRIVRPRAQLDNPVMGPVGPRDRVIAYEKAMRQLRDKYPDDFEAQTFYAFAILAVGYATPSDTTLSKQLQAGAMLEQLWKSNQIILASFTT